MATTIAVVSDVHAGSTVAVCPSEVPLDDGNTYRADSKVAAWLRSCWREFWDRVDQTRADKLYVVVNGDLVEGDHHGTSQIISRHGGAQKAAARLLLEEPLGLNPDALFFIRGTESHVGKSGSSEESIARALLEQGYPVQGDPATGTSSWWHLLLRIHDRLLSFAHHGRMGRRPWTRKSNVTYLAEQIFSEYVRRGDEPPALAVRSHYHRYMDTGPPHPVERNVTRVVQTPAWQLHTSHGWKVVPEDLADIGGVIITVSHETIRVEPVIWKPRRPQPWTK